jgi:hypothetical protein
MAAIGNVRWHLLTLCVETGDVVVGVLNIEKVGMMVVLFVYRSYCLLLQGYYN